MATPDKIDLLGICASPRQGNTLFLLQKALATAATFPESGQVSAELIELRARRIGACTGCEACARMKGECVIADDFQAIRDHWVKADVVLYATPVYHLGIPGQLKCFIDRLGNSQRKAHEVPSPRRLKVVGVISPGLSPLCRPGADHSFSAPARRALELHPDLRRRMGILLRGGRLDPGSERTERP